MANENLPQPPPVPAGMVKPDVEAKGRVPFQPTPAAKSKAEEQAATQITEDNNPADELSAARERMLKERGARISLNNPDRRLEVPPLPGYHLHWFLERNIPKAIAAWYEFVTPEESPTADRSIGGRTAGSTSEDLGGSRIAQIGGTNEMGLPEQLILMKIRQEWYFEDQRKIAERNLSIIQQIFQKKAPVMAPQESQKDYGLRYTREAVIDMSNGRFKQVDKS